MTIEDRYGDWRYLRQWSLDESGDEPVAVCVLEALDTTDPANRDAIPSIEAANAAVRLALGVSDEPSQPLTMDDYERGITTLVEATAAQRGYDSSASCASYALDPNPIWRAEARAFIVWRSAVYVAVYAALGAVQAGGEPPTVAQLLNSLPALTWPAPAADPT